MLCGTFPFKGIDDISLFKEIKNAEPRYPPFVSVGARSLINKILNPNNSTRISAACVNNFMNETIK